MDNSVPQKRCSYCREKFPATLEYFYSNKGHKDGLCSRCKVCHYKKLPTMPEGHKKCSGCGKILPATVEHFESRKDSKDGFRNKCQNCLQLRRKEYYEAHRDEVREAQRNYREAHKKELAEGKKRWQQSSNGRAASRRYGQNNREKIRVYRQQYYKTDHGKMMHRIRSERRRARKRAVDGTLTPTQIQRKLKAQRYRCYYCLNKFEKKNGKYVYQLEHTVPLSRPEEKPRHDENYVVLACPSCNNSKNNKLPHEWIQGGRLL